MSIIVASGCPRIATMRPPGIGCLKTNPDRRILNKPGKGLTHYVDAQGFHSLASSDRILCRRLADPRGHLEVAARHRVPRGVRDAVIDFGHRARPFCSGFSRSESHEGSRQESAGGRSDRFVVHRRFPPRVVHLHTHRRASPASFAASASLGVGFGSGTVPSRVRNHVDITFSERICSTCGRRSPVRRMRIGISPTAPKVIRSPGTRPTARRRLRTVDRNGTWTMGKGG